jgi:hypothetical protein
MAGRAKRIAAGCAVVVAIPLVYGLLFYGPVLRDFWVGGILPAMVAKPQERTYEGDSADNLRSLFVAMKLYHDSEERFPEADGWMNAIQGRVRTTDMPEEEAAKKFVRPDLADSPGSFGYAMNPSVAGKYVDDIEDPDTILLFESSETGRNAHGDPDAIGLSQNPRGITVTGDLVNF